VECTTVTPSESWTSGAIVSTPHDIAAFLDGLLMGQLLAPAGLIRMLDCTEVIDRRIARGLGIVRYTFDSGVTAYGHQGGMAGFTSMVLRTDAGRCVVLYQNALDLFAPLNYDAAFIAAAVQC
jgi:D-alanyl-D-alanine carboxypeptidase